MTDIINSIPLSVHTSTSINNTTVVAIVVEGDGSTVRLGSLITTTNTKPKLAHMIAMIEASILKKVPIELMGTYVDDLRYPAGYFAISVVKAFDCLWEPMDF